MFYRNPLRGHRAKGKRLVVKSFGGGIDTTTDDALLNQGVAKISYNLSGKSGALRESGGVVPFKLPLNGQGSEVSLNDKPILRVWYFKRYDAAAGRNDGRILLLSGDLRLYNIYVNGTDLGVTLADDRQFNEIPEALNYRLNGEDVMIFCSGSDAMRVYNGVDLPQIIASAPRLSSMCVHSERLFATSPDSVNTLLFSDDLDPTNWNVSLNEAGYIEMADDRGELLKALSFLNYVYVFRSYGISRLYASGAQSNFSLVHLFVSSDKIYGKTVCVCGDRILFLTRRGLFAFDGSTTVKILDNLSGLFEGEDNSEACAAYFAGKYYLACRLGFSDGVKVLCEKENYVNNSVIELDLHSGKVTVLRGMDANCLASVNAPEKTFLLMCLRGEKYSNRVGLFESCGRFFDRPLPKRWVCPSTDLDSTESKKLLRYALVDTRGDITLSVEADGEPHYFFVRGAPVAQRISLNLTGFTFRLSLAADTEKMYVSRPQLVFKEY